MHIIKYRPVARDIQNEISNLFHKNWLSENDVSDSAISQWSPQVDIKEESDRFLVTSDLPGVDPKDIDISMENNILTIRGHRKLDRSIKEENYSLLERFSGTFYRQFTLPDYVNNEKIQATVKHGVLTIVIPKKERHVGKKIEVQALE